MGAPPLGAWHPGMGFLCLPIDGCRMPRPYSLMIAAQPVGFLLTPDRPHTIIDPPIGRGTAYPSGSKLRQKISASTDNRSPECYALNSRRDDSWLKRDRS